MKNIILRLIVVVFLIFSGLSVRQVAAATQIDIPGPAVSGHFGERVTVLPNGNIVVADRSFDAPEAANVGAIYLYNGATGALISRLMGSTANDNIGIGGTAIRVLPNSNFLAVNSSWDNGATVNVGAVVFCNGTTGCSGVVSSANSLIGSTANDQVGGSEDVEILTNGNYVVRSYSWDNGGIVDAGAATFCNGTTGCTGIVSATNSLVGSSAQDSVGSAITALTNGNYVVSSPFWSNGSLFRAGAATFCNGTTGCTGTISAANSLVGASALDHIGVQGGGGIDELANGNYIVRSSLWNNSVAYPDAGAVTFCSGTTGCTGTVSAANSLTGSMAQDQVGFIVTIFANGNYVLSSSNWRNGAIFNAGAVTFCNGTTGCTGAVSAANSLVGSSVEDFVGNVIELANGNYVVSSSAWRNGANRYAGAVTFCNGTTGCTGTVSAANSLVGLLANEQVGRVTALTNGNYVVNSQFWNNGSAVVGAVTWCNGTSGCTGLITPANSLVGSTEFDFGGPATALTNGNYVVNNSGWDNGAIVNAGAVTWCNGTTGCTGTVSPANSLVGSTADDRVGNFELKTLANGNYVVRSPEWHNGAIVNAGAVTFCNGASGCTGVVSAANSLVGSSANDAVGINVAIFANGNYVVSVSGWNNGAIVDVGAVTFCNGTTGCAGAVSAANSLVGVSAQDSVGIGGAASLANGNYVVGSWNWDNGAMVNAGAVTWCNGTSGCTGAVSSANSLVGSTANDRVGFFGVTALINGNYVVRSLNFTNGAIVNAGAISYGNGSSGTFGTITADNSVRGTTSNGGTLNFSFDTVNNQLVVGRPLDNIVTLFRTTRRPQFDFDGDGTSDISVYRPSNGVWYLLNSHSGFTALQFGISTDKLAPADFDGDGKTDLAVYRDGIWYLQRSTNGFAAVQFGLAEDLPTPADYDGDGKADIAVFRPSNGFWYRLNSSDGQFVAVQFGISEDKPTLGDFDGDNKSDIAVFRPSSGVWHRINSSNGQILGFQFGISEDKPVAADYDGDGRTDIAVYRPSNGVWYRRNSTNSQSASVQFGISEDVPTPADYDGDGRTDIAVFRPSNGIWYRLNSTNSQFLGVQFGIAEDKPIPSAYLNSNFP